MARNRKLSTDADFQEAMEQQMPIRVFQDEHMVDAGGVIIRFDEEKIVIQSSVSEMAYYDRNACEFFEMPKK